MPCSFSYVSFCSEIKRERWVLVIRLPQRLDPAVMPHLTFLPMWAPFIFSKTTAQYTIYLPPPPKVVITKKPYLDWKSNTVNVALSVLWRTLIISCWYYVINKVITNILFQWMQLKWQKDISINKRKCWIIKRASASLSLNISEQWVFSCMREILARILLTAYRLSWIHGGKN